MNRVRISGPDRSVARTVLLPKRSVVAVNTALGTHVPPVLVTETFTNAKGRTIGIHGYPLTIQQLVEAALHGDL